MCSGFNIFYDIIGTGQITELKLLTKKKSYEN